MNVHLGLRRISRFLFDFLKMLFFALGDVNDAADDAPGEAGGEADQGEEQGGGGFDIDTRRGEHPDVKVFADAETAGGDGQGGDAGDGGDDFGESQW